MGRSSEEKKAKLEKLRARQAQTMPGYKKVPKVAPVSPGDDHQAAPVLWSFAYFDDYDWRRTAGGTSEPVSFVDVAKKLKEYSARTWHQIKADRARDHAAEPHKLCKEARDRLVEIQLDDIDELFRFRFTGPQRLWGCQCNQHFVVLWWDPDHQVWPISAD